MVGTGSRLFFALAAIGLLGAAAFGLASGGDPVGVMSLGYKGGVGEHFDDAVHHILDQRLVVTLAHHPDHRLGAGRADRTAAVANIASSRFRCEADLTGR